MSETTRRLHFQIFRYNPEDENSVPHTDVFELDETPFMTLYIALNQIRERFREIIEYFGQSPIIVRSSSLLEDSFGNAFAGKYESLFLVNQGDPEQRYSEFVEAGCAEVQENGIEVKIADTDMTAFIRRSDLARDRSEQRPERFAVGEKVDARITQFDKAARKVGLSIKALEIAEEKAAVQQYGSSDSGASLGDILGAALNKQGTDEKSED